MIVLPTLLCAQDPKPRDYSGQEFDRADTPTPSRGRPQPYQGKQADVNGKTIHFDDLHYGTISPPIRESSTASPLSKGDLRFQRLELNELKPNSVELSTLSQPVLPKANFTAKRAAADRTNDQASRQLDLSKRDAPITNRVIRPFTPGGEEELKNQLNKLHP